MSIIISRFRFFLTSASPSFLIFFFFFNDTATTEIYTLSLHDALPILVAPDSVVAAAAIASKVGCTSVGELEIDRKSTRLNSSHANISYAVFCLKKKKKKDLCVHVNAVASHCCRLDVMSRSMGHLCTRQ